MTISILSLHTYPVKSCAGITHTQIGISAAGLDHDRQWVVVDTEGQFMTQRQYPQMVLVQPTLDETALFLNAPEMPTLRLSLAKAESEPPAVPIRIWNSDTIGTDEGDTAAQWFSDFLGRSCRLYRTHPAAQRLADPGRVADWRARQADSSGFSLEHAFGFADAFPFLIANQASLDELNQRLEAQGQQSVPMNRFRPNIVIQGLDSYEEDYLSALRIGSMMFAVIKRCTRCPMPNVDASTAAVGTEPMATLTSYRQFDEGVLFGVSAVVDGATQGSVLSVGERVTATLDI